MNNVHKLHARLIKLGQHENPSPLRNLLHSCLASANSLSDAAFYAHSLLLHYPAVFDTVAYNSVLGVLPRWSFHRTCSLFSRMHRDGVRPDNYTFPFVLKACSPLKRGFELSSLIVKLGFDSDIYVQNALINFYGCCGFVDMALRQFDEMPQRDLVSWSSLISCLIKNDLVLESLALFQRMQLEEDVKPDGVIMLSVLSAISILGALELGIWVHVFIARIGLPLTVSLGTSLIDMYSRCGCIDRSIKMFNEMPVKNVITWTTFITGLAVHGYGRKALNAFYEMKKYHLKPDSVAFVGALLACSHSGLVEEGWEIFGSMRNEYHIEPTLEHYGCMTDLLGRAGLLLEAFKLVEEMPIKPNSVIRRTLLGSCVKHNNLKLAEKARNRILELDPHHDGDYVLLSNAYGGVGKWTEKAGLRNSMKENKIIKEPGHSLINIDQAIHEFVSGDCSHPQWEEIRNLLVSVIDTVKVGGYSPNTSSVLHDIQEEEKEHSLSYHSEKLAVAYMLLNHQDRKTIRIMKNLRICCDCHDFMKHVSNIFDKDIIIRDQTRFHHFSKGSCSCQDYW